MATTRTLVRTTALLVLGLAVSASPALAHPGHAVTSFGHGLLHLFEEIDGLLAVVAIGLLAAGLAGPARRLFRGRTRGPGAHKSSRYR